MPTKDGKHQPGYKLPNVIEPENCCICIPIPNDYNHKMAFLGQLDELGYWWNWERDPLKQGKDAAAVWRKIVACIREDLDMSGCGCGDDKPTNTRINPETGIYEVSYDGGITWEPDPGNDPRQSGTVFPPLAGDPGNTLRCEGANSALGYLQEVQAAELVGLENNASIADFITMLTGFLGAIGIFFAFVPGAIAALLSFVVNFFGHKIADDFENAFTETLWDELFCILYCHIEPDGSYTEAGWMAVKDELDNDISNYGLGWMYNHINLIGTVGLTNAARASYPGTRPCAGCGCDNPCIDTDRILMGTLVSVTETEIVIQAELTTFNGTTAYWAMYGSETDDFCCLICTMTADPGFTSAGWTDCDGNPQLSTSPNGEMVRNVLGYNTGTTYQMTITIQDDCPE